MFNDNKQQHTVQPDRPNEEEEDQPRRNTQSLKCHYVNLRECSPKMCHRFRTMSETTKPQNNIFLVPMIYDGFLYDIKYFLLAMIPLDHYCKKFLGTLFAILFFSSQ